MDLLAPIDQYCERTNQGLLGEPLNLFTNIGFIIAGLLILKSLKSRPAQIRRPGARFLGALILVIGVGSALFHSFANVLSMWADVLPIGIFLISYLWLFLRHVALARIPWALTLLAGFFIISFFAARLADPVAANGGQAYFGTWITLFGIACFYGGRREKAQQLEMTAAAIIFSLSLFLRTVDEKYCGIWPHGTHVFWHVLNSVVLYLVTKAYISTPGRS